MSVVRNRELSQFGSFIHIDDQSRSIGITTGPTPNVGIGTTNPSVKFEVVGNTNIGGNLTVTGGSINASSYTLNGSPLVDASIDRWSPGSGSDIYRLDGNIGIGTSVTTQKLTVLGNVSAGQFISTVTSGTAPLTVTSTTQVFNLNASLLAGKTPPAGDIVGTTDTQTLTNKTLTSPVISSIVNGAFSLTVPSVNGTLVSTGSTGTVTSNMIADLNIVNADVAVGAGIVYGKLSLTNSIVNADVAVGAGITYGKLSLTGFITNADIATGASINVSKLSASTISGITLGSNLATLTFGTYLTGTSYNGSTAVTIATNASTSGNSNIVARDGSGDFTAGTITATLFVGTATNSTNTTITNNTSTNADYYPTFVSGTSGNLEQTVSSTKLTFNPSTGTLTCIDLNTTSDLNLKENIKTVENSLNTLTQLRGVSFDWKETGKSSYGVIAQELEEILPDLVTNGEVKTVNYNGIIGVLIEAIKELKTEVEELKRYK